MTKTILEAIARRKAGEAFYSIEECIADIDAAFQKRQNMS